jgi:ketosteroid isomerase-like protein
MPHFLLTVAFLLQAAYPGIAPTRASVPWPPTDRFVRDMRAKDIADVLSMYEETAIFIDPEGHTFIGAEALRKLYEQVFATYDSDLHLHRTALEPTGRIYSDLQPGRPVSALSVETGDYDEDLRLRATGAMTHLCGGYKFTWRFTDQGTWLISRMEWTSKTCEAAPVK